MPSILLNALRKKITFGEAAREAEQWASNLLKSNPAATALASTLLASVKQGASNMVALADTELAQHFDGLVNAVEAGADATLLGATGGKALPAVPIVNATIQQIAAAGKAALDAWALQAQANLAPSAAPVLGQTATQSVRPSPPVPDEALAIPAKT